MTYPTSKSEADIALLNLLLAEQPSPLRQTTIMEALDCRRSEPPHSLFLAWLLSPQGPLNDHWLLRRFMSATARDVPWPGNPHSVLPEVSLDSERPDIVVDWGHYLYIVEYKIDSPEGPDQVKRYLKTFKIASPKDGRLVYLTPTGRWPNSVEPGDERVCVMSFRQLVEIIDRGLADGIEPTERGRAMVGEYRDCLNRVLSRSITVGKPNISEATKLLSMHHKHFDRLMDAARQETSEFIQYVMMEAEARMRAILGRDMPSPSVREGWGYYLFRKPTWRTAELEYGFAYGAEGQLGSRLMHEFEHCVCVEVQPLAQDQPPESQKALAESLRKMILPHLSGRDDGSNRWFATWENMPLKPDADWDAWAAEVLNHMVRLARKLTPVLDRFAAGE